MAATTSVVRSIAKLDQELREEKRDLYNRTCDAIQTIGEAHKLDVNITQEMLNAVHAEFVNKKG